MLINPVDPIIVGRYLQPLVALMAVAIAFVVGTMPRRIGPVVAAMILGGFFLLELGGLGLSLSRFYA